MTPAKLTRRRFLQSAGFSAAVMAATRARAETPPNVLVIQPDQHCATIMGCAGDLKVETPNLDRLAGEGTRFSRCASASPVCSPFRATFQTGLYPHKHRVVRNNIRLDPELRCFAEVFEDAGYATGYIGKWHLDGGLPANEGGEGVTPKPVGGFVPTGRRQGWQEWDGYEKSHEYFEVWKYNDDAKKERVEGYDWEPTWHTDTALDFIRRNRDEGKPWLYYLAYGPPHVPEQCPEEFMERYPPESFVLPPGVAGKLPPDAEASLRKTLQIYYAQISAIDREVGRLLDSLSEMGVDDNTIILYTSDHGDKLGRHWSGEGRLRGKSSPYASAFRIPLIVRWPEHVEAGQVCDTLVSSVDLTPTLLELAGLPAIPGMQGNSMADWCSKGRGPQPEGVWIGLGSWRAAWDGRYIYARGVPFNHLYDHETDPHETKNLLRVHEHRKTRRRMHRLLLKLAKQVDDPMLKKLKAISS